MNKYNNVIYIFSTHGRGGSVIAIKGGVGKAPWARLEGYSNCWFAADEH